MQACWHSLLLIIDNLTKMTKSDSFTSMPLCEKKGNVKIEKSVHNLCTKNYGKHRPMICFSTICALKAHTCALETHTFALRAQSAGLRIDFLENSIIILCFVSVTIYFMNTKWYFTKTKHRFANTISILNYSWSYREECLEQSEKTDISLGVTYIKTPLCEKRVMGRAGRW